MDDVDDCSIDFRLTVVSLSLFCVEIKRFIGKSSTRSGRLFKVFVVNLFTFGLFLINVELFIV